MCVISGFRSVIVHRHSIGLLVVAIAFLIMLSLLSPASREGLSPRRLFRRSPSEIQITFGVTRFVVICPQ
jgi:hypothetical protein